MNLRPQSTTRPSTRAMSASGFSTDVSIDQIENLVENLYEGLPEKITAAKSVLQLAKRPENLAALAENENLMAALARVLIEDGRRSMDLSAHLLTIFFCFSNFSTFHPLLTRHKIGDASIKSIARELDRSHVWHSELCSPASSSQGMDSSKANVSSGAGTESADGRKFRALARKQDQLYFAATHLLLNLADDVTVEVKMIKRDIIAMLLEIVHVQVERRKLIKSKWVDGSADEGYHQELMTVVLSFLKKVSLYRENIGDFLVSDGKGLGDLLTLCFHEPQKAIADFALQLACNLVHDQDIRIWFRSQLEVVENIVALLSSTDTNHPSWSIIYLLCLDKDIRHYACTKGLIPIVMKSFLESAPSADTSVVSALACSIAWDSENGPLICGIEAQSEGKSKAVGLRMLLKRALKYQDCITWKLLRIICTIGSEQIKMHFFNYIEDIMKLLVGTETNRSDEGKRDDLVVELWAILVILEIPNFDYDRLVKQYNLTEIIVTRLMSIYKASVSGDRSIPTNSSSIPLPPGCTAQDDVGLEVIQLIGTMAHDERVAEQIAMIRIPRIGSISSIDQLSRPISRAPGKPARSEAGMGTISLFRLLFDLIRLKKQDCDFVAQVLQVLGRYLNYIPTRALILTDSNDLIPFVINSLVHASENVRTAAQFCLASIEEAAVLAEKLGDQSSWVGQIKTLRFQVYHQRWINAVKDETQAMICQRYDEEKPLEAETSFLGQYHVFL